MGCCGGSDAAAAIMVAKASNFWFSNSHGGLTMAESSKAGESAAQETGDVRMNFVGPQAGSARYIGKVSGRTYYAGNNENDRVLNVDAADVEHFEALRYANRPVFERADKPKKSAAKEDPSKAPEGFEWSAEKNAFVPVGMDWINGAWVQRPELAPNGTPETSDETPDPRIKVVSEAETNAANLPAPGPEGKDAIAVDNAAASNAALADGLAKTDDASAGKKK